MTLPDPGVTTPPTDEQRKPYTQHTLWDDETGERVFIEGHVEPPRRAIAAANHWARVDCGLVNLTDGEDTSDVQVGYSWFRPDPQSPMDDETMAWCSADHEQAEGVTIVSWT